jgi:cytidylate kinase
MAVVTVSRLYGIGGREFGQALADDLGYAYVDKELLGHIAAKAGASEDAVSYYEGTAPGPAQLFRDFCHRKFPGTRPEIMDPTCYADVLRAVIEDLARRDRVVIVGRGAQSILSGHPGAVHLRLIADREHLVRRLAALPQFAGVSEAELWRRSERYRQSRRLFVRQHFGCDIEDPLLYHLVMNLGRLSMGEAVRIVAGLVRRREPAAAGI